MSDTKPKIQIKQADPIADSMPDMETMLKTRAGHWKTNAQSSLEPCVQIMMFQSAYKMLMLQCHRHHEEQHGGYLVGRTRIHKGIRYITVEHVLAKFNHEFPDKPVMSLTNDDIVAFHNRQNIFFPEKRVVGWYRIDPESMTLKAGKLDIELHRRFLTIVIIFKWDSFYYLWHCILTFHRGNLTCKSREAFLSGKKQMEGQPFPMIIWLDLLS